MYEELIGHLRYEGKRTDGVMVGNNASICNKAADAIEELTEKCQSSAENNIRLIEQYDKLKNRISKLNDHQHYSGAYIKSIMGVEEWEK